MHIYIQIYPKSDPTVSSMKQMDKKGTAESIKADSAWETALGFSV